LVVWFENPWGRKLRQLRSGQLGLIFSEPLPKKYLAHYGINAPIKYSNHHASHAAGGYFTSGFDEAAILVIDAIGEMSTASIWHAQGNELKRKWSMMYPHSIGLFYSAITDLVGLKANEEEYILMGMAAYGKLDDELMSYIQRNYFKDDEFMKQRVNFHRGIRHDEYLSTYAETEQGKYDLAAAAQWIVEEQIVFLMEKTQELTNGCRNLVYSGGVALNCVANAKMTWMFENVWIMPNPGDAGNSLGAIANYLRKPLNWKGPFLGYDIKRRLDVKAVVQELLTTGICGVATGRAEFGPRALGNRSLLADPRRPDMKDRVNEIKRRQKFRPFAPAVIDVFTKDYFHLPANVSRANYMQYVVDVVEDKQALLPAITHFDGTARVQTVDESSPALHDILREWHLQTGCPVLLNTSLNIKGEPLVNTEEDARRWEERYNIKVF
jgi:carbamoyltransferase